MKLHNTHSTLLRFGTFVVVIALFIFGGLVWWRDGVSSVDPSDTKPVTFVVGRGEGVRDIASKLAGERLIRSSTSFFILVKLMGIERNLQAGDFRLSRAMDGQSIARELTHGIVDVWVTTLEGWRVEEVANKLAKELDIPEGEFLKVAREGYMFPDTYLIPRDATAGAIVNLFQDTFEQKITPKLRDDTKKSGLSFSDIVVLASIVEREGRTEQDRPMIAGILLKRLKADWPLQTDATVQYGLGYQSFEKSWWKKYLSIEDKKIRSPYNTYIHTGLPPGPIANPGLSSIEAVIYPTQSPYWYYLHDQEGRAHYATTLQEHERNIATYLQ